MKTIKVLGLSLLQTLIYVFLIYLSVRYYAVNLVSPGSGLGAIGIVGGADGPTAIFLSSNFDLENYLFHFSIIGWVIAFIIANVSSLMNNKVVSVIILVLIYLFTAASLMITMSQILWKPVFMLIILAGLMVAGYFLTKRLSL